MSSWILANFCSHQFMMINNSRLNSMKWLVKQQSTIFKRKLTSRTQSSIDGSNNHIDIPTVKGIYGSSIGLLLDGGPKYLHLRNQRLHAKLGPIYQDILGNLNLVFVADVEFFRKICQNEGRFPHHNIPEAWKLYNENANIKRGLFFQEGEEWLRLRKPLGKILLNDISYMEQFRSGLEILTARMFPPSKTSDFDNVKEYLCKWSLNCTSFMLFGQCLDQLSNKADKLVELVSFMFKLTSKFQILPANLACKLRLKVWKDFETINKQMLEVANDLCQKGINLNRDKISDLNQKSIVYRLIHDDNCNLTYDDINRSMIDLLIAAADTTSNSMQWVLHCLGKNPKIQEKLFNNKTNHETTDEGDPNYLTCVIKEANRLYPTAPFIARKLNKPIFLDKYIIPAERTIIFSLYSTSRSEKYFYQADKFLPERWLTKQSELNVRMSTSLASLPFGIGARTCIGKQLAKLQMNTIVSHLSKNFLISIPKSQERLETKLDMILVPEEPITIKLDLRDGY